jgi:hypothetical protein
MTQSSPPQRSYLPAEAPLPTSGLATASLLTGILGFIFAPILCSIIARARRLRAAIAHP